MSTPAPAPALIELEGSSNIAAYAFTPDEDTRAGPLRLKFKSGSVYEYAAVPAETVAGFLASESKGGYFAKLIKTQFACTKIEPAPAQVEK